MVLKWWGTEGGRSPSAGSLSIRPGRICRFTGPPQNPNTATIFDFTGLSGRCPATRSATAVATPRLRNCTQRKERAAPGGRTSQRCPAHGTWSEIKTQARRDPNAATVSEASAGAAATARSAAQPRKPGEEATPGLGEHLRRRFPFGLGPARPARFDLIRLLGQQDVTRTRSPRSRFGVRLVRFPSGNLACAETVVRARRELQGRSSAGEGIPTPLCTPRCLGGGEPKPA